MMNSVRSERRRETRECVTAHEMSRRHDQAAALLDRAIVCGHHRDWVGARRWIAYAAELHSPLLDRLAAINDRALFLNRTRGMARYLRREAAAWRAMMN
ncbi:MAG: hypothetical protein ACYCQK_02760 [Acidiferrobacteraceae bacterium]